jgi:hypothetical protein
MPSIQKISTVFSKLVFLFLFSISIPSYSQTLRFEKIIKTILYQQGDELYLILHESFYQTKSESYSQGNTRSSGYNTSRISVYDLKNGKPVAQKVMGNMDSSEYCLVMGCSQNNLWLYSNKYKSGLQSINPITLERKVSEAYIYSHMKQSIGRFAEPNWQELDQFYGFDPIQQKLVVSNQNNQKYYLDPENFSIEKTSESINLKYQWNHFFRSYATIRDSVWNLEGSDKMVLVSNSKDIGKPEFLEGKFMMEQNPKQLFLYYVQLQEDLTAQINVFKKGTLSNEDLNQKTRLELKLNNAKINTTSILKANKPDDVILQPSKDSFFVWSKNEDRDESVVRISKIANPSYGNFSVVWETRIPGMFFNVATARNSKEFKQFFGDFIPESESVQFELINQQLVIIYLSQVCCIDANTGVINWAFFIK